jgi:acyl-CoA thioesterase-2
VPEPSNADTTPEEVDELIRLLDLEELDRDLFRARNPRQQFRWRLFGGQVAAQAVRAASLTVPEDRWLHSLHGYFLRPGDPDRPILLHVDRDRDGRSFTARHVVARQRGDAIFTMLASFHAGETGAEHQELPAPRVPAPEDLEPALLWGSSAMFDVRPIWGPGPRRPWPGISHIFWARARGAVPDDRLLHACVLTFLSDVGTGFIKLPVDDPPLGGPSLDHAVWFHRPVRMDEWVLVDLEPVVASGGRAYYTGAVYDRDGRLLASISQEHIRRPNPPDPRRGGGPTPAAPTAPAAPPAPSG